MGVQLSLAAHTAPSIAISSYIDVLDEVHYLSQLNSSRFLKTCKAVDPNGEIVIKVFLKPSDDYELATIQKKLQREALVLAQLPNTLNYSKIVESDRAGYLIRQHLKSSAYDRLSTRPFLEPIELKFIVFQFLRALDDIHSHGICHGDLKLENLLLTSWNWLVLADFSNHLKPTYLPEDNPGEYAFYFDTSQRRSCYIAPERFDSVKYKDEQKHELTCEMDLFSAGCCIAEIFTEGYCIFNLSQLFRYQNGEYDPREFLDNHLDDGDIKDLIMGLIKRNPAERISVKDTLQKFRGNFFPEHFYTFYYDYFRVLSSTDEPTPMTDKIFSSVQLCDLSFKIDEQVERIYRDFPKICSSLGYPLKKVAEPAQKMGEKHHLQLSLPNVGKIELQPYSTKNPSVADQSSLLLLSILLPALRAIKSNIVKLRCIELVLAFSQYVSDNNKLDRIIPFIVWMFFDDCPGVQALSVHALSQLLTLTTKINRINESLFTDYLLPRLKKLTQVTKHNEYVRMALAEELGEIAESANRFHEYSFSINKDEYSNNEYMDVIRKQKRKLIHNFEEITVALLTDNQASVKIALLSNILPLCTLFGREKANDVVLSHLITYLNDKNASLRISLMKSITGIAILLGPITLEQYILPLLIQTITDSEELVVVMVLKSLKTLCSIGLVHKKFFFDISNIVSALLLHPNVWIRRFALSQLVEISDKLSRAEVYCLLYPIIKPYFEFDVQLTLESMISSCKKPLTRTVYNLICTWSLRSSSSLFWKQIPSKQKDSFGNTSAVFINKDFTAKNYGLASGYKLSEASIILADNREIMVTNEDKGWLEKIKAVGLKNNDIWKITSMRSYVFRVAKMIARKPDAIISNNPLHEALSPKKKGSLSYSRSPRNVFFDILFLNNGAQLKESSHMIVKNKGNPQQSYRSNFHKLALNSSVDLTKSIQMNAKASATLTSNLDNVYVQLEGSKFKPQIIRESTTKESSMSPSVYTVKNSYEGHDKNIHCFLRSLDVKPSFRSFPEFSHFSSVRSNVTPKATTAAYSRLQFLFQVTEGKSSTINVLAASPHDSYVLSGSEEGYVKLWNIPKVLAGETHGPSLILDTGSSVVDIKPIQGFDLFAVASRGGTVLVVKVNTEEMKGVRIFTSLQVIRKLKLRSTEYPIQLSLIPSDDDPLIVVLTNTSAVLIVDPRFMSIVRRVENDPLHGAVLCFAVGPDKASIIMGSSRGVIDVWDSRFGNLIQSWTFSDGLPITSIVPYSPLGKREERCVLVVGGSASTYFTLWDYSRRQCKQIVLQTDMIPPIGDYIANTIKCDKLKTSFEQFACSPIGSMVVQGQNVLVSALEGNSIMCFNPKEKTGTQLATGNAVKDTKFKPIQLTASTTVLIKQRTSSRTEQTKSESNLHNATVSSIAIVKVKANHIVISADRSGVINIYK
ncbi:LADA_0D01838g1_1 [Lachancea dasiensis]|uniref:non-specific serine/threonine protein kinase n=1 Tax=Lachancea dasiensis TaxID=1072105 RepID=A0A1G4J403_9SACH|nr:LADA_0D01838g1_1 [Lachancea dasiensis]